MVDFSVTCTIIVYSHVQPITLICVYVTFKIGTAYVIPRPLLSSELTVSFHFYKRENSHMPLKVIPIFYMLLKKV